MHEMVPQIKIALSVADRYGHSFRTEQIYHFLFHSGDIDSFRHQE